MLLRLQKATNSSKDEVSSGFYGSSDSGSSDPSTPSNFPINIPYESKSKIESSL
jgi:hypothetical protein